jgi:hypothetical protein
VARPFRFSRILAGTLAAATGPVNARSWANDPHLGQLTGQFALDLVKAYGMGTDTATKMLLLVGDNREGSVTKSAADGD